MEKEPTDNLVKHLSAMIDLHSQRLDSQANSIDSITRILEIQDKEIDSLVLRIQELEKRMDAK